jgi:hypothetical protein
MAELIGAVVALDWLAALLRTRITRKPFLTRR